MNPYTDAIRPDRSKRGASAVPLVIYTRETTDLVYIDHKGLLEPIADGTRLGEITKEDRWHWHWRCVVCPGWHGPRPNRVAAANELGKHHRRVHDRTGPSSANYELDFGSAVKFVASELERGPRSLSDLAFRYRPLVFGDVSRIREYEGLATEREAKELLVEWALNALGDGVTSDGDTYRLTVDFEELRWRGQPIPRFQPHLVRADPPARTR